MSRTKECCDETELTILLAFHLFSQLSTSPHFTVDNRKANQPKECPCRKRHGRIMYGDTSIGTYVLYHDNRLFWKTLNYHLNRKFKSITWQKDCYWFWRTGKGCWHLEESFRTIIVCQLSVTNHQSHNDLFFISMIFTRSTCPTNLVSQTLHITTGGYPRNSFKNSILLINVN